MLKRKFKKLVNNPKLFFSDMAIKHRNKIGYFKPKKMDGHFQYTVVSAVYNVEQYLNDYFNGFIKQRLDFKRHIKLILVDDGSKDNSADIIKRWQKKYPNNITYIYKENGGQASARNLGLEHVTTEWVTFIDPDDFVDSDYFYSTDNELEKLNGKSIAYAACNIVLYNEDSNTFSNKHPLAYKFNLGSQVISVSDNRNLQLSSASAFFNINTIKKHNVKFPENVKPTFEDAYFINSITKHEDSCLVISNAHYFYRRRDDNNSTVDLSWEKPERYTTIFENGYTKLLKESIDPSGKIPKHIQRVVFYDLAWYIKRFVFHSRKFQQLPPEWQASLKKNLKETISFIDDDVILDYNLAGFWWFYKYGTILYKNSDVKSGHSLYLHSVDQSKKLIEVSFFCAENMSNESFEINGIDTIPHYFKDTHHKLCDDFFIQERKAWIPYENINQKISAKLAGVNRSITIVEGGRTQASHKIA
ncbi:TPA: glycosyltransferase family A protein, partial [Aeromonas veronii]